MFRHCTAFLYSNSKFDCSGGRCCIGSLGPVTWRPLPCPQPSPLAPGEASVTRPGNDGGGRLVLCLDSQGIVRYDQYKECIGFDYLLAKRVVS